MWICLESEGEANIKGSEEGSGCREISGFRLKKTELHHITDMISLISIYNELSTIIINY